MSMTTLRKIHEEVAREEDTTDMFGESISKEDSDIIDFINERELFYESESRPKILKEVEDKFGNKGKEVLSQLTEDILVKPEDLECEECGAMSKELLSEANEKIKLIEIAFDGEFDEVVKYVIDNWNMGTETRWVVNKTGLVEESIVKFTNYKVGEIPDEFLTKIKIKILLNGIQKGWLLDELFK